MHIWWFHTINGSVKASRDHAKYVVQVHFRGGLTIKNLLMGLKDKEHILKKSGDIYRYKCDRVECDKQYIGESARTFAERLKNNRRLLPQYMTILTPQVIISL